MTRETRIDIPQIEDGAAMWRIARDCKLDSNSPYKYLLFCRDFAESSAIATVGREPVGFLTGYLRPGSQTLFVWQIGVLDAFRGYGLASRMLMSLMTRSTQRFSYMEATVTPGNVASTRLFERFAETSGAAMETSTLFEADLFPEPHEPEVLFRIGPLPSSEDTKTKSLSEERSI